MDRMIRSFLFALATTLALTSPAMAQEPEQAIPPISIPSDHWIYPLLDRMAADGLLDGEWLPGRRPVGGDVVDTALDTAVVRAERDAPAWVETARSARQWLHEEYGLDKGARLRTLPTAGGRVADGPLTESSAVLGGVKALYRPVLNVGVWAEPALELDADGVSVPTPRLGASWAPGPFRLTTHYGAQRLGIGSSGGIVLSDDARMPWLEMALDEPTYLPWLLKYVGPFQISASASRIGADSLGPTTAFFSGEFRVQPFPWFTGQLSRSAVVAWEVNGKTMTPKDLLKTALGTRSGTTANFDDQKASMAYLFRFRIAGVAVNPYAIWAWEDTWEIDEDPGTILGVSLPAVPVAGRPVGVRYEYTAFGEDAQIIWPWHDVWQHRSWYRHCCGRSPYVNNDGELLGHPLGGYGAEHRIDVEMLLPERHLMLQAGLFTRQRIAGETLNPNWDTPRLQEYSNLLYDEMPGRSWGSVLEGVLSTKAFIAEVRLGAEFGVEGWNRLTGAVQAKWLLP